MKPFIAKMIAVAVLSASFYISQIAYGKADFPKPGPPTTLPPVLPIDTDYDKI